MARRIIVKKILSGIPNITKLTGFSDVNDSGLSGTNGYLKYDSASQKFNFVSLASITSGVSTVNSLNGAITIAGAGTVSVGTAGSTITITGSGGGAGGVDSAAVNTLIAAADTHDSAAVKGQIDSAVNASFINALTIDADTLGGQNSAYHLNYNNFTNKPTIPTVDSATILPLARAAITAGSNITYDSATGVISSTGGGAGGADSTSVQGQIDSAVTIAFINSLSGTLDADTLGGNDSAYYLNYNNFTNKPTIPTVDSATIQPFARAAITAGSNITYDSATGVIASTASGGTDSATVVSIADSRIGVSSIGALSNVDLSGISTNNILKWDGAKFVAAVDATSGGGSGIALSDLSATDAGGFGSFAYNNVSGVFTYTGADSAAIKTVTSIPYANLTGTPTIPTVDSAAIRPFARAAITAGSNITYDSATGVIAAVIGDTHDSAAVQGQIDSNLNALDTHDSVAVQGQIDSSINNDIVGTANEVEVAASGGVATIGLPAALQITTSLTVGGNAVLTTASDTHDSAAVLGQINTKFANNATFSKDLNVDSNLTVGGYIGGPAVFTIDPAGIGDSTGKVVILGDLQVDGTQTIINSTTVSISDKNIVLADSATNASQADGAGITINGASATLQYASTGDKWVFNKAPHYNTDRLLTTADDTHDSAAVQGQIDSAVNQSFINALDTHDSAAVKGQIDSAVTIAFINSLTGTLDADTLGGNDSSYYLNYNNFINNPSIPALYTDFIDSSQAIIIADARIAAADTHDSNLVLGQINSIVDFNFITAAGKADSAYIKTVAGIDADTLDTLNSTEFLRSNTKDQKTAGSLVMNDGIAIKFGTDSDHSISEVSGNLEINTVGTTFFKVNTAGLRLHNQAGTENLITASQNGAVALYYDGVQRAITTNTGLNITGFLDADSIQTTHIDIFDVVNHKPTAQNAGAGQTTVKAFPHLSVPCSIEYSIHMKDVNGTTTKGETSYTKVVATLDSGLNTAYTEFSTLFTGDSEFGTFDVDADATNINLKFTRRSGRDGTVRVQTAKTLIGGDG